MADPRPNPDPTVGEQDGLLRHLFARGRGAVAEVDGGTMLVLATRATEGADGTGEESE
jgi:hypothetical protein